MFFAGIPRRLSRGLEKLSVSYLKTLSQDLLHTHITLLSGLFSWSLDKLHFSAGLLEDVIISTEVLTMLSVRKFILPSIKHPFVGHCAYAYWGNCVVRVILGQPLPTLRHRKLFTTWNIKIATVKVISRGLSKYVFKFFINSPLSEYIMIWMSWGETDSEVKPHGVIMEPIYASE